MPLRRRQLAGLSALELPAPGQAATIVLFHGYGADGADLAGLAQALALPRPARWLFPDAPLSLEWGGRAWFPIDAAAIERAQRAGTPLDWSDSGAGDLERAAATAGEFLQALGAGWGDLILGGFSQGAMLAAELALRAPENPRGLVLLSGNLINAAAWRRLAPARRGLPFFQSHGSVDPILGFPGALKLEALLRGAGLKGRLLRFEGGHAIAPEVLESLRDFLSRLV
ncbi:MAG: hypothetical protein KGO96_06265 [Elusimicrobia bacterium]|nr:hypothetical protein [Elusimicrobiota bacterium]MDE2425494.1 hypothetical protein [Elusimicrobiota bacterium]